MLVLVFFDSGSEVNAIHPTFAKELGFSIKRANVGAQKIDSTMLDPFRMVVTAFSLADKANQVRFFKETFLVANVSSKVVLEIPFLTLSDTDVNFLVRELWWRTYTTKKALLTIKYIELVGKKEFAAAALNLKH